MVGPRYRFRAVSFDRSFWEERWSQALREHADQVAQRPPERPSEHRGRGPAPRARARRGLRPRVRHALARRARMAGHRGRLLRDRPGSRPVDGRGHGAGLAERIDWVEGDLATWTPQPDHYDLVVCLYVHVAGSVEEMVRRMATGVAPGGTLFLVGHRPIDPATGAATAAAGQVQVSVDAAVAALDPGRWELIVAEDRPRAMAGTGVDAVIRARRLS